MFWNESIETMPRAQIEDLQLSRLRQTVSRALSAPYYRRVLDDKGLSADSIKTLSDLQRFPLTTKDDMRSASPQDFLAVPTEHVVRLHVSSGTTGRPTAVYHSRADIDVWSDLVARCMTMVGMTSRDVFQNMVGYGLFTGGLGMHYGAERLGATAIPVGTGNSRRQVFLMKQFGTTVIHIIPSYALKLLDSLAELGVDPKADLDLQLALIGAEPHSPGARKRIEEGYGLKAYNSYGLSEMNGPGVAFECLEQNGSHLWEDNFILEVLDPITLEPVPDGQLGEIVMTTLCREAMPLIRYRTRDLAMVLPEPCPCGRTHRRISRITGRTDDLLILKGVNIFPMQIERILMEIEETGRDYQIVLDKDGPIDIMTVRVEMNENFATREEAARNAVSAKIARLIKDEILINPRVELLSPGALPKPEGKAVRVRDNRPPEN